MNRLSTSKRAQIVASLVEGNSIRATVRMTGAAKNTVMKLLLDLGQACQYFHDETVRGLSCKRIEVDEIWSFCYAKAKNVPIEKSCQLGVGDIWTWTAICADTKLVPCWVVGGRDAGYATAFMYDLASRLTERIQLTSDGYQPYLNAVPEAFGNDIDYAMLVKMFREDRSKNPERKYSPGKINGARKTAVIGSPDIEKVSTSYAERLNLTTRMSVRRFTRLTNAFSTKLFNLECAVALHFTQYNFCRKHQTLKTTPAVAANVTDHVWPLEELVGLLD